MAEIEGHFGDEFKHIVRIINESNGPAGNDVWVATSTNGERPWLGAYVTREDFLHLVADELEVTIVDDRDGGEKFYG